MNLLLTCSTTHEFSQDALDLWNKFCIAAANIQTPDFAVSPALPRDSVEWVKLLELKGPEAKILANRRHLHRGLAPAVIQAIAQVNDYNESIRDPLNLKSVEKALG